MTGRLPDCAIEWAEHQISEFHRSRREIADQLGINRRTLDRRLAGRAGPLLVRCWCGAVSAEAQCIRGHVIPVLHRLIHHL